MIKVVLDTNIVLDLFVFHDAAAAPLQQALDSGVVQWISTLAMRDELARVLGYPQIQKSLQYHGLRAEAVLAQFDTHALCVDAAAKATVTCKDADDQKFIDLAVAHGALLLSKDHAVLCMTKRLQSQGVQVLASLGVAAP